MSLEQRVGQLFMVGTPAGEVGSEALASVTERHVGSVFLSGRSAAGVAAAASVVRQFSDASDSPLFVATDQEGGQVQVLSGPGFTTMPSGLEQGSIDPAMLQADAQQWGSELAEAGVNLNLAPVADIVSGPTSDNLPIAHFDRQYGYDAATVDAHAGAFMAGMTAAGIATTLKHFPGLGYVTDNTDTASGVTDVLTGANGPTVASFGTLIDEGSPLVMMSSAIYTKIDPTAPAVFSPTAVAVLRDQLDFDGVIATDDLSGATQVQYLAPADRAIEAIEAGCDLVLVTRTPAVAAEMIDAVVAKAQTDDAFAALVDDAARHVLTAKHHLGLG